MPAWVAPLQKGMQLQQGGRWAEAADAYKEACAHEMPLQQAVAARSNLGLAFQNTEQYERALAAYDDALKLAPTYADGHHNRGNALYKLGRFDDAAEAFGTAVKCARSPHSSTDPRHASHAPRSSSLHLRFVPTDGESHFNRGNALDQLGRHDEAAASFGAVLKITPGDEAAAYNLGNSLKALGKTDEALEVYRYALKRQQSGDGANPREPATHANIGYTLDAAGRYGEAIGAFQASLALLPSDASVHTGLGHALKSKGDMSAAADAYRKALSIEPTASAAYAGLGQALRTIDPKGAAAALALGGDSLNAEADKVRAWLERQPAAADGGGSARDSLYPDVFESAPRCKESTMADAVAMGATALAAGPPMKLAGGTAGWLANGWNDTALAAEVGESAMRMLVMPQARAARPSLAAPDAPDPKHLFIPASIPPPPRRSTPSSTPRTTRWWSPRCRASTSKTT